MLGRTVEKPSKQQLNALSRLVMTEGGTEGARAVATEQDYGKWETCCPYPLPR